MNDKQHTIQAPVTVRGIGLHTGVEATMTFCPAPVGHGFTSFSASICLASPSSMPTWTTWWT